MILSAAFAALICLKMTQHPRPRGSFPGVIMTQGYDTGGRGWGVIFILFYKKSKKVLDLGVAPGFILITFVESKCLAKQAKTCDAKL